VKPLNELKIKEGERFVSDSRFAINITWWRTEKEAIRHATRVRKNYDKYKGGFFDGCPCGREQERDGDGMYAVTWDRTGPK
jgi:hypothetical protein